MPLTEQDKTVIEALVTNSVSMRQNIQELEEARKGIAEHIKTILDSSGEKAFKVDGVGTAAVISKKSERLDKNKLKMNLTEKFPDRIDDITSSFSAATSVIESSYCEVRSTPKPKEE